MYACKECINTYAGNEDVVQRLYQDALLDVHGIDLAALVRGNA